MILNNELNKHQYTNVGARSSLDLGSLGRSDQSTSVGASALASQLLQHQQQVCNQLIPVITELFQERKNTPQYL